MGGLAPEGRTPHRPLLRDKGHAVRFPGAYSEWSWSRPFPEGRTRNRKCLQGGI